jgi:MSHA biogenesis protein MshJ
MKQHLLQLAARIDALSLREQALVFAAAVVVLAFGGYHMALAPIYREQEALLEQILQQRNNMMAIDTEIAAKVTAYQLDPDAAERARLEAVAQEAATIGDALLAMQNGLVPPERMAPLVDAILRANGRLQLVSMRTLPVETISGRAAGAPREPGDPAVAANVATNVASNVAANPVAAAAAAAGVTLPAGPAAAAPVDAGKLADLLYRHGVEVTVRGNYLDMVDYMSALEAMPTRLFWGKAQLEVEEYPASRLTLTLYTLSLDRNWMKL